MKLKLFILLLTFSSMVSYSQYKIYVDEQSYEATDGFVYYQNAKTSSFVKQNETIELSIGQKANGGIILLEKYNGDFFNKDYSICGNLYLYLFNGAVIKCIDRKMYGYVDDTASALYYLTSSEIQELKKSNIISIRYSLTQNLGYLTPKRFSANNEKNDTSLAVKALF